MGNAVPFFEAGPTASLGPLERQVLEEVWARRSATVRELIDGGKIWQTYPTIMTTMDRLFKKGFLNRVLEGRAFRYFARYSPQELERLVAVNGIRQLLGSDCALLHLSYLVEAVGAQGEGWLDELQALIERRRAEIRKGEPK